MQFTRLWVCTERSSVDGIVRVWGDDSDNICICLLMSFVACEVINRYDEELFGFTINQKLNFNFGRSMLLNVIIIGLVLLLVHLVSKKPLKVKPTEVLRYE